MSHELSFREDGSAEMIYVHRNAGDVPWHGYGTPIPMGLGLDEAIAIARLGWPVVKSNVLFRDEKGDLWPFPDRFVTYRQDRSAGLGIVGSDYRVVQNAEAFRAAVEVARMREATVETMGALYGGRVVWCLLHLPETFNIRGDKHIRYILAYTSHDGSTKVRFKLIAVRVVCRNTADAAFHEKGRCLEFAHTADFDHEIEAAKGIFEEADDVFEAYRKRGERLQEIVVPEPKADLAIETFAKRAMWSGSTREELEAALASTVLETADSTLERVLQAHEERRLAAVRAVEKKNARYKQAVDMIHARLDEEREGADVTAWLLGQSMTGWVDHERSSAKGERRFSSLLLGQGDRLKNTAWQVVEEIVQEKAA